MTKHIVQGNEKAVVLLPYKDIDALCDPTAIHWMIHWMRHRLDISEACNLSSGIYTQEEHITVMLMHNCSKHWPDPHTFIF